MDLTCVILISNGQYYQTRYSIETLLNNTNCPIVFYFIIISNKVDSRLEKYINHLSEENYIVFEYIIYEESKAILSEIYNDALIQINSSEIFNYTCIFPFNILVDEHWLEDLIFCYENYNQDLIEKKTPGILSIKTDFDKDLELSTIWLSSKDDYEGGAYQVWFRKNNFVSGIMFFKIIDDIKFKNIGAVGFEEEQFSFEYSINGYSNFFIRKQVGVKLPLESEVIFAKKKASNYQAFKNYAIQIAKEKNKNFIHEDEFN